jgi:hypothetical protein
MMLFTISKQNIHEYPHCQTLVAGYKLYTNFEFTSTNKLIGYKLGDHGGNFIEFIRCDLVGLIIKSSFFKDFDFYSDSNSEVLLSNNPHYYKPTLRYRDTLVFYIDGDNIRTENFSWNSFFQTTDDTNQVLKIKERLIQNINTCHLLDSNKTKIAFTGGLDSGTLAFLVHHYKQFDFDCIVNQCHVEILDNLMFDNVIIESSSVRTGILGGDANIKETYYQEYLNHTIHGFYGDCTLLHNSTFGTSVVI